MNQETNSRSTFEQCQKPRLLRILVDDQGNIFMEELKLMAKRVSKRGWL
jgi:hypothetical protein